jgi:hypothetical protein
LRQRCGLCTLFPDPLRCCSDKKNSSPRSFANRSRAGKIADDFPSRREPSSDCDAILLPEPFLHLKTNIKSEHTPQSDLVRNFSVHPEFNLL